MASPRVLAALGSPILFDYDPVFLERFRETERLLAEVYRTTNDVVLMQGEAVLGLEAAARGLVTPGMRCLNLVSGVYAAWFGDWLREYGAEVSEVRVPYDEALDPAAVERALADDGPFELVSIVHSETPSGIENPLAAIGPLAHAHGALVLADVVSSLGGTALEIDEWNVDLAVAGPQKCLAGPPGMSLVTVSPRAWEAMESNPGAPRGSFLSLLDWKHKWIDGGRVAFPYTPSVSDVQRRARRAQRGARGRRRRGVGGAPRPRRARHPRRGAGARARAVAAQRRLRGQLRDRRARPGRRGGARAARARARALRRDALGRLRGAEGDKLVRLGHMGPPAARSTRWSPSPRSVAGWPTSASPSIWAQAPRR